MNYQKSILIKLMNIKIVAITLSLALSLNCYSQNVTSTVEYDVAKSIFTLKIKNNSTKRLIVYGGWGTVENHTITSCVYNSSDKCLAEGYYSLSDVKSAIIIEPNETFCRKLDLFMTNGNNLKKIIIII